VNVGLNSLKISGRNTYVDSSEDALNANIYVTQDGVGDFGQLAGNLVLQARTQGSVYRDIIFAGGLSNGDALMTILGEGNVGIGTTSPNNLLTLYSASSAIYTQWVQSGTGTSSTDGLRIGLDASSNGIINLNEGTALITSIDGTECMRITLGGNVGVNCTATNARLEVVATSGEVFRADAASGAYRIVATQTGVNMNGNVGINTLSPAASSLLDVTSTTQGFLPPRMTTTQKNAIGSPAAGLIVFDTTLVKLCVHNGTTWETITSL
jgi:hypothetical protein